MYAIVKTGGKQYKVAAGDKLNVEKIEAEVGQKVELDAICIVDGDKVIADPAKAAATKVVATVLEQFKGEKQLVFKFKKRKNYKKLQGHRQLQTRLLIESIGAEKAKEDKPKKSAKKKAAKVEEAAPEVVEVVEEAKAAVEAVPEVAEAVEAAAIPEDLESLKVAELKEIAAGLGLEGISKLKKAELIDAIKSAQ